MQAVVVFTDTGYAHWKDLSRQRPSGKCLPLNFSDRFRVVFEFYFTGLLNGIELYNILKTRFKNYSKVMMQLCILMLSTWVSLPHSFICTCQAVQVCLFFKVGCFYWHWLCSRKRLHIIIICLDYLFLFDWACLCSQKGFSKQTSFKKNLILMLSVYWLCVRVDHMVKTPKKRVGGWIFRKEMEMSNEKTKTGKK